jgi:lysophospholipase L1-like esterase
MFAKIGILAAFVLLVMTATITPIKAEELQLDVIVLGDSYSSGTGGLDYSGKSGCYRSANTYGKKFVDKLKAVDVNYTNLACHGATVADLPDQIDTLSKNQREMVDLVLLTIGGNDAGFKDLIIQCFVGVTNSLKDCAEIIRSANNNLENIMEDITRNLGILAKLLPNASFILVGYPNPIDSGPNECNYALSLPGLRFYAGRAMMQMAWQAEANQYQLVDNLNKQFDNRFEFVSLKSLFNGHENCGDKVPWLRGNYDTANVIEWWHPNEEGYSEIADFLYEKDILKNVRGIFNCGNPPLVCGSEVIYQSSYNRYNSTGWIHSLKNKLPLTGLFD